LKKPEGHFLVGVPMAKRTMNAKEFLADIKTGMDDAHLMEKYRLSRDLLQSVFEKLVDMGLLNRHDLEKRTLMSEKSFAIAWECPACGIPQPKEYNECPRCGIIAAKFKKSGVRVWDFWEF
jgi:rubrerythrin